MKKILKYTLFFIILLPVLIAFSLFVLTQIINPNDYKQEIEDLAVQQIGRKLSIRGNLNWSFFPSLGLATGAMTLSNAPGFGDKPMLSIEGADIQVALLPLLDKQVEVKRLEFNGVNLNLQTNADGSTNWQDLTKNSDRQDNDKTLPTLAAFIVGGLTVNNAEINWLDKQNQQSLSFQRINLQSQQIIFGKSTPIQLAFVLHETNTESRHQVQLNTEVYLSNELDKLRLQKIKLTSNSSGTQIPGKALTAEVSGDIRYDLNSGKLSLIDINLANDNIQILLNSKITGLPDNPQLQGQLKVQEFDLANLFQSLDIPVPQMQNPQALASVALQCSLQADKQQFKLTEIKLAIDNSQLTGNLQWRNWQQPEISYALNIDQINLDDYLSLANQDQQEAKAQTISTPGAAILAASSHIPLKELQTLNANGELHIELLTVNNLQLQDIAFKLKAKEGELQSQQSVESLYKGNYRGSVNLNVSQLPANMAFKDQLTEVQLEPLLTDLYGTAKITGSINAKADLRASGQNTQDLKKTLNGDIQLNFSQGEIRGFNLQQMIAQGKALLEKSPSPEKADNNSTPYADIFASAKVKQGIISNNDLNAYTPGLRINGQGLGDINTQKIDYTVTARRIKTEASATQKEQYHETPVIIKLSGTFSKPQYTLDIKNMIPAEKQQKILQKVEKKLGKKASRFLQQFLK